MAETTNISWSDRTWSPWYGCTQVSMGEKGACVACYARQLSETRMGRVVFGGPGRGIGTRDVKAESGWKEPLKWEREAAASKRAWFSPEGGPHGGMGRPWPYSPFIFPSMCDPFDNHPDLAEPRRRFFDMIRATPHLTWLLLTKRPQNIIRLFRETTDLPAPYAYDPEPALTAAWPRNAAIGFTAVTPEEMDRDSRVALRAFEVLNPAFLFWSGEPLLAAVVVPGELLALGGRFWAITGGETDQGKHRARITHPDWERAIRDQCAAAGVPYHRKQAGEWIGRPEIIDAKGPDFHLFDDGLWMQKVGKKAAGRLLDGVTHDARPEVAHG